MNCRRKQCVLIVVPALAAILTACSNTITTQPGKAGFRYGTTGASQQVSFRNNVSFVYAPTAGSSFTNRVRVYTSKGCRPTNSHRYGWAQTRGQEVYLDIPNGVEVLDLYAEFGTAKAPKYDKVVWNPGKPIPFTWTLTAEHRTLNLKLTKVHGEFYSSRLPLIPAGKKCLRDNLGRVDTNASREPAIHDGYPLWRLESCFVEPIFGAPITLLQ